MVSRSYLIFVLIQCVSHAMPVCRLCENSCGGDYPVRTGAVEHIWDWGEWAMVGAGCTGSYVQRSGVPQLCCRNNWQNCGFCDSGCGNSYPVLGGTRLLEGNWGPWTGYGTQCGSAALSTNSAHAESSVCCRPGHPRCQFCHSCLSGQNTEVGARLNVNDWGPLRNFGPMCSVGMGGTTNTDWSTVVLCCSEDGCPSGYFGLICTKCPPCYNGGACRDGLYGDGICICTQYWTGTNCETDVLECTINPTQCGANSVCNEVTGGTPVCTCISGYTRVGDICTQNVVATSNTPIISGTQITMRWNNPAGLLSGTFEVKAWQEGFPDAITEFSTLGLTAHMNVKPLTNYHWRVRVSQGLPTDANVWYVDPNTWSPVFTIKTSCTCAQIVSPTPSSGTLYQLNSEDVFPSPGTLTLTQQYSQIYVTFHDTSNCESSLQWQRNSGNINSISITGECGNTLSLVVPFDKQSASIGSTQTISTYYVYNTGTTFTSTATVGTIKLTYSVKLSITVLTGTGSPINGASISITIAGSNQIVYSSVAGPVVVDFLVPNLYTEPQTVTIVLGGPTGSSFKLQGSSSNLLGNTDTFSANYLDSISRVYVDTTVISVSGYILYESGTNCGTPGVEVCADSVCVISNSLGFYSIPLTKNTPTTITATLSGHTITSTPSAVGFTRSEDAILNWTDSTRTSITVTADGGNCGTNVGTADIRFSSKNCTFEFTRNIDKISTIIVFPMTWDVQLLRYTNIPSTDIGSPSNYFATKNLSTVDASSGDASVHWTYRSVPSLSISGISAHVPPCWTSQSTYDIVLQQDQTYEFTVVSSEMYTQVNGDVQSPVTCNNADVSLQISDGISTGQCAPTSPCTTTTTYSPSTGSTYKYIFTTSNPKTDAAPYTKTLTFTISQVGNPSQTVIQKIRAIITGGNSYGSVYTSTIPAGFIPLLALRRPPGGLSYATFPRGTALSRKIELSSISGNVNLDNVQTFLSSTSSSICIAVGGGGCPTGIIPTTTNEIASNFSNAINFFLQKETRVDVMFNQQYSTTTQNVTDDSGDVIFSPPMKLQYSHVNVISFDSMNTCDAQLVAKVTFNLVYDSSVNTASNFFTVKTIQAKISQLDNSLNSVGISNSDKYLFQAQKEAWEDNLQLLRETATSGGVPENSLNGTSDAANSGISTIGTAVTFVGGTPLSYTTQYYSGISSEVTIPVVVQVDPSIGTILNADGTVTQFASENGTNYFHTVSITTSIASVSSPLPSSIGFTTYDLDSSDQITTGISRDPLFGVPIFSVNGGQTSCPHVPNTVQLQTATLSVENPNRISALIPPTSFFDFTFTISNTGIPATWIFNQNTTSTKGLSLSMNNVSFVPQIIKLPENQHSEITISIALGSPLVSFVFDNVSFTLTSECDPKISYGISISLGFLRPCARPLWASTMKIVLENNSTWIVNVKSNNTLDIAVTNPDFPFIWGSDTRLNYVKVQYTPQGDSTWTDLGDNLKSADSIGFISKSYDISEIPDGNYCLRLVSDCVASNNPTLDSYTGPEVCGVIDRITPNQNGQANPRVLVDSSNEISIYFNENVDCTYVPKLITATSYVSGSSGTNITLVQSCSIRRYVFQFSAYTLIDSILGKNIRITVSGVSDLSRNAATRQFIWQFAVNYSDPNSLIVSLFDIQITSFGLSEFNEPLQNKTSTNVGYFNTDGVVCTALLQEISEYFSVDVSVFRILRAYYSNGILYFDLRISKLGNFKKREFQQTTPGTIAYQLAEQSNPNSFSSNLLSRLHVPTTTRVTFLIPEFPISSTTSSTSPSTSSSTSSTSSSTNETSTTINSVSTSTGDLTPSTSDSLAVDSASTSAALIGGIVGGIAGLLVIIGIIIMAIPSLRNKIFPRKETIIIQPITEN